MPKVTVITRKAYGGAYDVMSSKHLRGDVNYRLAVGRDRGHGARRARSRSSSAPISATPAKIEARTEEYREKFANPFVAGAARLYRRRDHAARDARERICRSLAMLRDKQLANPWQEARQHPAVSVVRDDACSRKSSSPIAARSPAASSATARAHGHRDGRGLFRCRRRGAACARWPTRPWHRPAAVGGELSADRRDRRGLQADRRRGGASGLRLPLRERSVRRRRWTKPASSSSARTPRAIAAMGDKIASKKLAREPPASSTVPGIPTRSAMPSMRCTDRPRDRLSGDDQGFGRRRRQGHAHRARTTRELREGFARGRERGTLALSATTASSSRNTSTSRAISRSRCWATRTATSSISASANARSSAGIRR